MARVALITTGLLDGPDERMCFEARGHQLVTNTDLARALETLLNDPPDILIIQKDLPQGLDRVVIQALKNNLQLVLLPILLIADGRDFASGLDWYEYPVDDLISRQAPLDEILLRVDLALSRTQRVADNNPLTKLPGNSSILKNIQEILDARLVRGVGYVDIDHFKPYNDRYGFARGDEVIRMVARILVNVVQDRAGSQGFVGHVGGDDFVFSVPLELAESVCSEVLKNFSSLIPLFLDEEDIERGFFSGIDREGKERRFPLTSLSIAVVSCTELRYRHYGEVAAVAAQLKSKVKDLAGNNFLVDRRRGE